MTVLTENEGLITQIIGPVIDVEFQAGNLPEIYDALEIYTEDGTKIVAEVQQLLGENKVRSVAMSSTDGLQRGMKAINTKNPIEIPVGKEILGRILNVLGEPVDEMGEINTEMKLPIHRPSPKLVDQNTNVEILETGIKAIDLLQPYQKGGKDNSADVFELYHGYVRALLGDRKAVRVPVHKRSRDSAKQHRRHTQIYDRHNPPCPAIRLCGRSYRPGTAQIRLHSLHNAQAGTAAFAHLRAASDIRSERGILRRARG